MLQIRKHLKGLFKNDFRIVAERLAIFSLKLEKIKYFPKNGLRIDVGCFVKALYFFDTNKKN